MMKTRLKFLGHPIHPILIVVPLGLLVIAFFFDVLYVLTQSNVFPTVAYYDIAMGIIGGLAAAFFGFLDWLTILSGTRAKRIGLWHGVINVVVLVLFALSWSLRAKEPAYVPTATAFALSLIGVALLGVSGWLGGELVNRMGVGIEPDANPNAPSSLSDNSVVARHPIRTQWADKNKASKGV